MAERRTQLREERSRSRSSHRTRRSPPNPKHGGPFKVIPFDPKEIRADAYVDNFEQAIRSYYKSNRFTDYIQRQHFFEALSGQQRLTIGCMRIGGTYEEMKKSFLEAYGKRQYDTLVEMLHVRMREGETATTFANQFRGMLPTSIKADQQLAKFWFLNKLPSELWTRKAIQISRRRALSKI